MKGRTKKSPSSAALKLPIHLTNKIYPGTSNLIQSMILPTIIYNCNGDILEIKHKKKKIYEARIKNVTINGRSKTICDFKHIAKIIASGRPELNWNDIYSNDDNTKQIGAHSFRGASRTYGLHDDLETKDLPPMESVIKIVKLILDPRIEEIGEHAFEHCEILETVEFSKGTIELIKIDSDAFKSCYSLTDFPFQDCQKLKTIESDAFHMTSLKKISLPESIRRLRDHSLSAIGGPHDVTMYSGFDNQTEVIFHKNTWIDVKYAYHEEPFDACLDSVKVTKLTGPINVIFYSSWDPQNINRQMDDESWAVGCGGNIGDEKGGPPIEYEVYPIDIKLPNDKNTLLQINKADITFNFCSDRFWYGVKRGEYDNYDILGNYFEQNKQKADGSKSDFHKAFEKHLSFHPNLDVQFGIDCFCLIGSIYKAGWAEDERGRRTGKMIDGKGYHPEQWGISRYVEWVDIVNLRDFEVHFYTEEDIRKERPTTHNGVDILEHVGTNNKKTERSTIGILRKTRKARKTRKTRKARKARKVRKTRKASNRKKMNRHSGKKTRKK